MKFETYLNQSWNDHATQSEKVAAEFSNGASVAQTNEELEQLVRLVTHVMGEHLARWSEGVAFLSGLTKHTAFIQGSETEKAIRRSIASLQVADGKNPDPKSFGLSDQVRIFAMASSALTERDSKRSQSLLQQALSLAETGLDKNDPANRALAVTGNNLACTLEEKKLRTQEDTDLMILASQTGRKYWELAGGWLEVSRAEYRLAMTYLQAEDLAKAFRHAQICVEMCQENKAGDLDMFFAYEALAQVEKKKGNELGLQKAVDQAKNYFTKLSDNDKAWCEPSLKKLS